MRGLGRRFAVIAALACLHAVLVACASRPPATVSAATVPVAPEPERPPDLLTTVVGVPAPPTAAPNVVPVLPAAPPDECALLTAPSEPIATVGLSESVNPGNAPRATNDGERLLFRQLYETLVRVDCQGHVVSGLAEWWRLDTDGRTWILTLRQNARFGDGVPVTANDVRASWTRDGVGDELRSDVKRLVQSVTVLSDRDLAVTLAGPRANAPMALAHQDLAVAKLTATSWPLGTRPGWTLADERRQGGSVSAVTLSRADLSSLRFVVAPGDPRDLLDQSIDLLVTRDPAALDYAATLPQFQSVPLAWHRTRVLLTPGRLRSSPSLPAEARQALATDAVRGEARAAEGPFWWEALSDCEVSSLPLRSQSPPIPRVVYDTSDGAARDLSERMVGLTRASTPAARSFLDVLLPDRPRRTFSRATALTSDALAVARRRGADAAYVVSVESQPLEPCRELMILMEGAPWLEPQTIVPLVDTRLRAVIRRGKSGVTANWDGGLLIVDPDAPR